MRRPALDARMVVSIIAAVALLAAYWVATALASSYFRINVPQSTSLSSAPEGLRGAFEYLDAMGHDPRALRRFEPLPTGGTIVVAATDPLARGFSDAEADRLAAWVAEGGRLVLAGPYAGEALGGVEGPAVRLGADSDDAPPPLLPSPYVTTEGPPVLGPGRRIAEGPWVSLYGDEGGAALMLRAVGAGEVLWLADASALSNERIGEAGNGEFAVRLLADATPVHFDEYHHGFITADSLLGALGPGGQAALVLGALALAVLVIGRGRRLGPVIPDEPRPRARTLAYVDSLAGVYRTAGAHADALETLARGLERSLARRHGSLALGLKRRPEAATLLAETHEAVSRGTITDDAFVTIARRIARARQEVESIDG